MQFDCALVLPNAADAPLRNKRVTLEGDRVGALADTSRGRLLAMPPLTNAHDHARTVRMSSLGGSGRPLETWLHCRALVPAVDPYLAVAAALSRSALGGTANVMVHYTKVQGKTDLVEEVRQVARAARDVGVRVGFAVGMHDCNPLVYGPSEPIVSQLPARLRPVVEGRFLRHPLPARAQVALADEIAAATASTTFDVQYGPGGPHWASRELLEAVAEASAATGRRVHMHMLETRYQRDWANRTYPGGILRYLDDIGLLNDRVTLAHCTWTTDEELELIAERGVTIALNASSNLHLQSGVAPLARMVRRGCRVALGIDGQAFDEDDDALRELRVVDLLHGAQGFEVAVPRRAILSMALENGVGPVTGSSFEPLAAGARGDVLLLDWDALNSDQLRDDIDAVDLLFARGTLRHIEALVVGGRLIAKRGQVLGIDQEGVRRELLAQLRAASLPDEAGREAVAALQQAVGMHFGSSCVHG